MSRVSGRVRRSGRRQSPRTGQASGQRHGPQEGRRHQRSFGRSFEQFSGRCFGRSFGRSLLTMTALLLPLGSSAPGWAAEDAFGLDLELYRPTVNGLGVLGVEGATTLAPKTAALGLSFDYVHLPLGIVTGGEEKALIAYQLFAQAQVAIGVLPWLELGIDLPFLLSTEALDLSTGDALNAPGIGDVRLSARAALLPQRDLLPGVSLLLPVSFPTGDEARLLGEPGVTLAPQLVAGVSDERLSWALNLGYHIRPQTRLEYTPAQVSATLGNELLIGAAGEIPIVDLLRLSAGFQARLGFDGASRLDDPMELRLGARVGLPSGVIAQAGVGVGVSGGYGVPTWRSFVGLNYMWGGKGFWITDRDHDGVRDQLDACPQEAEDLDGFEDQDGCPDKDNDRDRLVDLRDACPNEPENVNGLEDDDGCPEPDRDLDGVLDALDGCPDAAEDQDSFEDQDGCPDPDNDRDGIPDASDECPLNPEDLDGFEDPDGCSDPDNDRDGIQDLIDRCPNDPELVNGFEDGDGCPDVAPAQAQHGVPAAGDQDDDGILDHLDACPKKAETVNGYRDGDGCPEADRDADGLPDAIDRCPRLTETVNGFNDGDGCPERDRDRDGIPDGLDRCPKVPESANGFQDEDGCPEWDRDRDGIPDVLDQCPRKPETVNGFGDQDGCPEADTDGDGIPDGLDRCPDRPETANGRDDGDGCPD